MALAYDQARSTRDVDALFVPAPIVRELAEEIGVRHGLETDWLNDAAKGFLPGNDDAPVVVFESESLLVQVPSAEYLLAMKLHASRDERDLNDAATLFYTLGYTTAEDGIALLARKYPTGQLLPRHRYIVQDVADRAAAHRSVPTEGVEARKARLRQRIAEMEREATILRPRPQRNSPDGEPGRIVPIIRPAAPHPPDPDPPGISL